MAKVFISHSSKDKVFITTTLLPILNESGIGTWYSSENIPSSSDWEKTIRAALRDCDWFLVVLSPHALESEWVQAEVHWALNNRKDRFVSIVVADCNPSDLHLKLIRYQHIDFRERSTEAVAQLLALWAAEVVPAIELELECFEHESLTARTFSLRVVDAATIGRSSSCDVVLSSSAVSRCHAFLKFSHRDFRVWISDGSANGVYVNARRITKATVLNVGDTLEIGDTRLVIRRIAEFNRPQ